jgi:hypothetical protein
MTPLTISTSETMVLLNLLWAAALEALASSSCSAVLQ